MKFDAKAIAGKALQLGAMQKASELEAFLALVKKAKPKTVVEIGTAKGGTLYALCQAAADDALIVSIDLPGGAFGGGHTLEEEKKFRAYARPGQRLRFLRLDSHSGSTFKALKKTLGNPEIDLLLIDGDHTYEGVKKDWEMYSPLVRDGGIIAFHDICHHTLVPECQVERVWQKVKDHFEHRQIIDPYDDSWGGIGIVKYRSRETRARKLTFKGDMIGDEASVDRLVDEIRHAVQKRNAGILLHLGTTVPPAPGFVVIDFPELMPWPVESDSVHICSGPHVIEHIKPWLIVNFFDELWRVMKPDGQLALSTPYAGSTGFWADPTHCCGFNEKSFYYFDPDHPAYKTHQPKPWRIEKGYPIWQVTGNLEVMMRPRK